MTPGCIVLSSHGPPVPSSGRARVDPCALRRRPTRNAANDDSDLPLPNVVLFPGVFLPLHIFETRRDMVKDALAGDG